MAYTPSARKSATSPNNFSGLRVDGNRIAMTGALGNVMQSQDAAGSPVTSPVTNGSGSGFALVVPAGAVQFTINSSVTCQVGEDSSYAQGLQIPASTLVTFDCADQANIYLKPSSGTNTIYFQFKIV